MTFRFLWLSFQCGTFGSLASGARPLVVIVKLLGAKRNPMKLVSKHADPAQNHGFIGNDIGRRLGPVVVSPHPVACFADLI
jgi:hypothetical protein